MNFENPPISVLAEKQLFIFDMDGTIYLGTQVFPFAVKFIRHLRENGKKVLFFTNNPTHTDRFYAEKLTKLGFDASSDEIMTAGDVTAEFLLRHRVGKTVYPLAVPEMIEDYRKKGIPLADCDSTHVDIVLSSFDMTLTYQKLNFACHWIQNGAEFLSTHPDCNCPTENGPIPDSGAIAACITAATGISPTYFGKPYPETMQMICESTGFTKREMCIFGDRLYTDIALGKRNDVCSVLVLTGETQLADVEAASEADRPDFLFPSLAEADDALFADPKFP